MTRRRRQRPGAAGRVTPPSRTDASLLAQASQDLATAHGFATWVTDIAALLLATDADPTQIWATIANDLHRQAAELDADTALHVTIAALSASCLYAAQDRADAIRRNQRD